MAVQIPFAKSIESPNYPSAIADPWLTNLLEQSRLDRDEPQWLNKVRQPAKAWVLSSRIPSKKDEDWRFIDLSSLLATNFVAAQQPARETIDFSPLPETKSSCVVFVNGIYNRALSDLSGLPEGIFVGNLAQLPASYSASTYFAQQHGAEDVFTALNTAGCEDVAAIWVSKNVVVDSPIQLVFISSTTDAASFTQPRTLVVAEAGASVSLIEEYRGSGTYFTNAVTEICLQANAQVNHTRLQQESAASFHIGKTAVAQERDSRYTIKEINFGGKIYRHNPEILQQGEQTTTNLYGLTVATEEQVADTHSIVALTKPYGTTDQLHKCIVSDRAHSIFNGKVFVPKTAQLTDANQLNRNLLLSSKARVDTKPELQITADNVKCAHGATVSQLEAEEIFYLRSRGLSEADANQLLIDAFAAEICTHITEKSLQEKITQTVVQKINHQL